MRLKKERESRVQRLFEQALKDEEFLVYYQPKVDIQTRRLIGAEALCRWMHEGKIIPPLDFIPALERGMDICRLDFYMLRRVCRDIRRWLDEGREVVRVSVNLSRRHMMDPDLFEHIVSIVDECRVPHQYIEIELTETTTDVEFKDLKRVVKGLQSVGISASVDDAQDSAAGSAGDPRAGGRELSVQRQRQYGGCGTGGSEAYDRGA